MNPLEELLARVPLIEERLNYTFANKYLLSLAFVHRSFFNENKTLIGENNERLEFLGDSVLGLLISDYLYHHFPEEAEGQLSHLRSHLVEASSCSAFLSQLGVSHYILLGKGEKLNDGRGRETILADLFEALIGAIYLDGGIDAVRRFFLDHYALNVIAHLKRPLRNFKAQLQDYSQKKHQRPPAYRIVKEIGPDHSKTFQIVVTVGDVDVGEGVGSSKKEAEQIAAESALKKLGVLTDG